MSQIILGPGELDDSAVSQNCPTWMTRNKFVPLAKRPESPSVRDARRLEKIGPVGHTALMESIVNMEEHEPSKLKPIERKKRYGTLPSLERKQQRLKRNEKTPGRNPGELKIEI